MSLSTSAVMHSIWHALLWLLCLVQLFATPWTGARQALLPVRFSRLENAGVGYCLILQS